MAVAQVTLKVTPSELQLIDAALGAYASLWRHSISSDALGFAIPVPGDEQYPDPRALAMRASALKNELGLK
jgi:hypothetical protein